MRCAIAYVPPPLDPLTLKAANWLGRDLSSDKACAVDVEGLTAADHSFLTALPRRSGFHAKLKPSFTLADERSVYELERRLDSYSRDLEPIALQLRPALVDSFFALVPADPSEDIKRLAANIVVEFDAFRRPMSAEDVDRRSAARFNPVQLANLSKWGSPFVFEQFRFHMTLTGPVDLNEREHVAMVLNRYFGAAPIEVLIDRLVLSVQDEAHAPFRLHSVHPFKSAQMLKFAV